MKYSLLYYFKHFCFSFVFIFAIIIVNAQPNLNSNLPCYSIATTSNGTSMLYEMSPYSSQWRLIDKIDRNNIKALAISENKNVLYAIDKNVLGTINPVTAKFNEIGLIGSGNGVIGNILLDDVYGFTYVPYEDALYASHRIYSYDKQTNTAIQNSNDLLFKIDPTSGNIVLGAFEYGYDYAQIDDISNSTISVPTLYDVSDITYNRYTGELLILHGYQLPLNDIITINNIQDGTTEVFLTLLFKPSISLAFDNYDNVFLTTLPDLPNSNYSGDLHRVNIESSGSSKTNTLDPSLTEPTYFNCLECFKSSVSISNCQPIIYLNNYAPIRNTYKAQSDLYSNKEILSNTICTAGNSITLGNHFSASRNINFTAKIENCN